MKKDKIIKLSLINLALSLACLLFVYLCYSFLIWKLKNPIGYITKIPNLTEEERLVVLTSFIAWQYIQISFIVDKFKS